MRFFQFDNKNFLKNFLIHRYWFRFLMYNLKFICYNSTKVFTISVSGGENVSRDILKLIAEETCGESYQAQKIELDLEADTASRIDSRESKLENPKLGETDKPKEDYVSLKEISKTIAQSNTQILTYFLDGSRHIYKIDDIAYQHSHSRKMVYPVVAGQVTVGCCRRNQRKMFAEEFLGEMVIALPDVANANSNNGFFPALRKKINEQLQTKKIKVGIAKILDYSTSQAKNKAQEFANRAISKIQDYMYQSEQNMVANLVAQNKLNQKNYLVKDGSLEYNKSEIIKDERKLLTFRNSYSYVIGVSKKFNPALWTTGTGTNLKPNPGFIAKLPLYHRTPVICYENADFHGDIKFAIWYLRIRECERTDSVFDGVVKIEKMLVSSEEIDSEKIDSNLVNLLSAYIINERNPVCYGLDKRWANHIYPIFLTEYFVKSRCISAETFLNLF